MYYNALSPFRAPICSICHNPVTLNDAKTDEDGNAIHEDCYLIKLGMTKPVVSRPKVSSEYLMKVRQEKQG
ncbi:MAG: hypothetical protein ABR881_13215 [Candidatus Sulfotelmatobacter sp.]|jgi:hypothetical protein